MRRTASMIGIFPLLCTLAAAQTASAPAGSREWCRAQIDQVERSYQADPGKALDAITPLFATCGANPDQLARMSALIQAIATAVRRPGTEAPTVQAPPAAPAQPAKLSSEPSSVAILYETGSDYSSYSEETIEYTDPRYGNACTPQVAAALKQRGFKLFPYRDLTTFKDSPEKETLLSRAKAQGLRPIFLTVKTQPSFPESDWLGFGTFRNGEHFAKFLLSKPYRAFQGDHNVMAVFTRTAFVLAEAQPVIKPQDLMSRGYLGHDFSLLGRDPAPQSGSEVAGLLKQMRDLFKFDEKDPMGTRKPTEKELEDALRKPLIPKEVAPEENVDVLAQTSRGALATTDADEKRKKYLSLTSTNILVSVFTMYGETDDRADDLRAMLRETFDDIALNCSKANYEAELDELRQLKGRGYTLVPVDLDAFQAKARDHLQKDLALARSEDAKEPSYNTKSRIKDVQEQLTRFDEIQALNRR